MKSTSVPKEKAKATLEALTLNIKPSRFQATNTRGRKAFIFKRTFSFIFKQTFSFIFECLRNENKELNLSLSSGEILDSSISSKHTSEDLNEMES
jgi:hypothetical protein